MMTINNVSTNSMSVTSGSGISSTESKTLQTQIAGKQQSLNKLTSDAKMTVSEKEKERRKINQEIAELNRKLRQEQLKEQEDSRELKKEQEKKKIIKEELLQELNPKKEDTSASASSSESQEETAHEDTSATTDIPVVTLKNVLSADSAVKLSKVEEQVSRDMEGRQDILAAEIQSDELYGMDTTAKKEELSNMRRKEPFQIESLHKKEDTSVPTMNLGSKIIIHE